MVELRSRPDQRWMGTGGPVFAIRGVRGLDPRTLVGHVILLDGRQARVTGIETHCVVDATSMDFGVRVMWFAAGPTQTPNATPVGHPLSGALMEAIDNLVLARGQLEDAHACHDTGAHSAAQLQEKVRECRVTLRDLLDRVLHATAPSCS